MKKFYLTLASAIVAVAAMAQGWPANYGGIMLQGFYWDSYDYTKWENLEARSSELGAIYDLIWVPNSGMTRGGNKAESMGYMPYCWLRHTTVFGSQTKLVNMIKTYGAMGTGIIEDVVINHKDAKANAAGEYLDFLDETVGDYELKWDNTNYTGIVKNDDVPGGGNYDTGDGFDGARDLDHTNATVQKNCITYQNYLLNELGYVGFRLDMTKGYAPQYTGKYNAATNPIFSVAEYFDGNTDLLKAWINGTTVNGAIQSAAFDFALKFAINDAFGGGNWNRLDMAGLIADDNYKRYAVTFVENHDTNEDHNKCGGNIEAANAFILAMPGTPCIFSKHYESYKEPITRMIKARRGAGVTNQSSCTSTSYSGGIKFETYGSKGSVVICLGSATSNPPSSTNYELVQKGTNYAFYITKGLDWENSKKTGIITGYPVIDKASGVYANSVTVTVKPSTAGTTLVYTTDGSNPTAASAQITGATTFTFTETTTLKVGVLVDGEVSGIVTRTYMIGDADSNSITVYVKADAPYIYAWDGGGGALTDEWPGTKLTQKRTVGGTEFYYKTFDKPTADYAINFVLNQGGDETKTDDITEVTGDVFYTFSDNQARDLSNIYLAEVYNPFVCIDKPNGNLPANKKVYLNASYGDATIVYTTDGSQPTASSAKATGSKELEFKTVGQNITVKAALLKDEKVTGTVTRNYTVTAATGSGNTGSSQGVTIYCKASQAPYLYSWDGNGTEHNGTWPGTKMTKTATVDGQSWWTYTYDVAPINIIFNDGNGAQTADITGLTSDSYFEYNGTTGYTNVTSQHVDLSDVDIPSCATWIDGNLFIYFEADKYFEPYTWIWGDDYANYTGGAWPGTALIDVAGVAPSGKNIYRWNYGTLGDKLPNGLLFSNFGSPQTADFTFVNGGYYTENGFCGVVAQTAALDGDVNGDGVVNAGDITALYNYLLNGDTTYVGTSDVNGDGEITSADVTYLYSLILR